MTTKDNKLKLQSLEDAISYPPLKDQRKDDHTPIIELDNFEYNTIKNEIEKNEKLMNLEGATISLVLEVVELLAANKVKYNVVLHDNIGFYWRGLPILLIRTRSDVSPSTMLYISVKVYKDELTTKRSEQELKKYVKYTFGTIVFLTASFLTYKLYSSYSSSFNSSADS